MGALTNGDSSLARRFPDDFLWGVGTSSYQIEGAVAEDRRGRSIWDVFTHEPGHVFHGDTGDIACDSYHRLPDDVQNLRGLGVNAYRFSISWSRVQPTGSGSVNQVGLDYYRRLVEQLCESGINPVATVYHWDLPQALEELGGWACRETPERLGEFAAILGATLGDAVSAWVTINEPRQIVHQGYRIGTHAPGRRDPALAAAATHHTLLAHGLALKALRQTVPAAVRLGLSLDPHPYIGIGEDAEQVAELIDAEHNRVYLDPVVRGSYPAAARPSALPLDHVIAAGDLELISAPIDFLGVNYYRPHVIRSGDSSDLRLGETKLDEHPGFVEYLAEDVERTVMGWPIVPAALRDLLVRLDRDTGGLPLFITENGCALDDYISPEGTIDDYERIAYIHGHLAAAWQAIAEGVNLAGYFHWSLMDNFEWAHGYRRRFGLHYVDFETGRRIPKRSADFYRRLASTGELPSWDETFPADVPGPWASTTPVAV